MSNCCDRLCFYETQQINRRWLIPLAFVLIVLAVTIVFILRFAVTPNMKAKVDDARLDTFQFTTAQGGGSFFGYNISVALALCNPNKAMSIKHTRPLVATFIFHDRRLHNLTVVGQGHMHHAGKEEVHLFNARGEVPSFLLGPAAADDFKQQNSTGIFTVEVRLTGQITYQHVVIAKKLKISMNCPLRLQLAPPGPEVVVFYEVNCSIEKAVKSYF